VIVERPVVTNGSGAGRAVSLSNVAQVEQAAAQAPLLVAAFQTGARANGGLSSLSAILDRLSGYRIVIVTERESDFSARWRRAGFEVHVWPGAEPDAGQPALLRRGVSAWRALTYNRRLASLVAALGCRIVHCNDIQALLHVAPAARWLGLKVVFTVRSTQGVRGVRWRLARSLSHRVVALSYEMQAHLERSLPKLPALPTADIATIYSIVDFERMRPPAALERNQRRSERGIAAGEFAIGLVGVFAPRKQQLELLTYLAREPAALPSNAVLYFIGDFDPARDAYARACQPLLDSPQLVGRVRVVGYTADIAAWYQALDVLVLPSRYEGLARAMIEALSCGLPVVSFDVCSAREVLERHRCGSVARQGDFRSLLAAVSRFAEDGGLLREMQANAIASVRRLFVADAAVAAYERLYRELEAA
jgi:glycosyltransferase involved in cell wall biosynthesis